MENVPFYSCAVIVMCNHQPMSTHTHKSMLTRGTTQVCYSLYHRDMWELEDKEQTMRTMWVHLSEWVPGGWTWRIWFCNPQKSQANALFSLTSLVCFRSSSFSWVKTAGKMPGQCVGLNPGEGFISGGVNQSHRSYEDNYQDRSTTQRRPRKIEGW